MYRHGLHWGQKVVQWLDGSDSLAMSVRWVTTAATLLVAAGIGIVVGAADVSGQLAFAGAIGAGIVLVGLTLIFPRFPILAYWVMLASLSTVQLTNTRVFVGPIPIGVVDIAMMLLVLGWGIDVLHNRWRDNRPAHPVAWPYALLFAYALLSAGAGAIHGWPLLSILTDVRVIGYLCIGYWAGRQLVDAGEDRRFLFGLLWISYAGYLFAQATSLVHGFQSYAARGGAFADYRDIYSPVFIGKYGVLLTLTVAMNRPLRSGWWALVLLLGGLLAVAASLARTDWISVICGIGVILILSRGRGILKLTAATVAVTAVAIIGGVATFGPVQTVIAGIQSRLTLGSGQSNTVIARVEESQAVLGELHSVTDWVFGGGLGLLRPGGTNPFQHNTFVWTLSKQGVLGLALFVLVVILVPAGRALTHLPSVSGWRHELLIVFLAGLAASVVAGYASGQMTYWPNVALVGMTLAWMEQLSRTQHAGHRARTLGMARYPETLPAGGAGR